MTGGRVAVVVQARMGSQRLPGKVLAEVGGRPILQLQLERLQQRPWDELVVATSELGRDDPIAEAAAAWGASVVRGSEHDVLGRFGRVLERLDPEVVVRLTADCPLTDPQIVADAIALHRTSGAIYTSNVHPRTFPQGLDVEVADAVALATAVREAVDPYEREHVTPFLYRHPERFIAANLPSGEDLGGLRWTVDIADDLAHVRALVRLVNDPVAAGWREFLAAGRLAGIS